MTPQDMSTGARARRRLKAQPQSITLWTLCWWTAVGCAAGTLVSIGILAWVKP